MTGDTAKKLELPAWLGTAITVVGFIAALGASYADTKTDVALLKAEILTLRTDIDRINAGKAAQDQATKEFYAKEWPRIVRLEANQGAILITLNDLKKSLASIDRKLNY